MKMNNTESQEKQKKPYPINTIRMGDITGPCGNASCPLAHKVRTYIRNSEAYKKQVGETSAAHKKTSRKICGTCACQHSNECPEKQNKSYQKVKCSDCDGIVQSGEACEDRKNKLHNLGPSPSGNTTTTAYVYNVSKMPSYKKATYGKNYVVENLTTNYNFQYDTMSSNLNWGQTARCCYHQPPQASFGVQVSSNYKHSAPLQSIGVNTVSHKESKISGKNFSVYNLCMTTPDADNECKCRPPKPSPPCKTFDCDCIAETANIAARKHHKPYCPSFKHKSTCPVMMKKDDEEKKKLEEEEDEAEPLPYGLPPIQLGPCPVMGKPCANPDGFAKMYKTQAQPPLPASYSDAGKVCCSKEYERIKKAVQDYMKYEKDHDYRCINKFDVDTERRCCDKEQRLLSLMGKDCCGSHKLAIQKKFKEDKQ